jgi:D-inositol-3-phosphate glycosyltransferase
MMVWQHNDSAENSKSQPLVTVIIPTYNRADLVKGAIESVLAQSYSQWELLVVDDASTDETSTILQGMSDERIRYIRHSQNRGGSAARNTGLAQAKGAYIAFLDSDDEWLPTKLEKQVAHFEHLPLNVGLVYTGALVVRDGGVQEEQRPVHRGSLFRQLLLDNVIVGSGSAVMIRSTVLENVPAALPAHWSMVRTAVTQLRHHQPQLVHINDDRSFLAWALAARYLRIPALWHIRNADGNKYLDPLRLRLADYLIFVADAVRQRFAPRAALPPNTTIYNAVDFERFHPVTADTRQRLQIELGLPRTSLLIGLIANLLPRKRPEWAVQAVIDLRRQGHDVHLVWCGSDPSDGIYANQLRQMVAQADMELYFHFLGYCAEVEKVMQAVDLVLLTSKAKGEAFPRVAIEAMACGTAVLSTRCGGVDEAIENGRNGLLVEANDYAAFLKAAEQLVENPDYRQQLAETAVTTVRARFSLSQISQQVCQVYDQLLGA